MNPYIFAVCLIGSYLLGSISFARIIARLKAPKADLNNVIITDPNSGESMTLKTVGATTASVIVGPKLGWVIVMLDILKGAIPALIFRLLFPETIYFMIIGIAVIIGHIWPIYYRFHGGGGLAATLGVLLVLNPLVTLLSVLIATIFGMFIIHETVFCFIGGPWIFLIWNSIIMKDWTIIILNLIINMLLILAIMPDIITALKKNKGKIEISIGMDVVPLAKPVGDILTKIKKEKPETDNAASMQETSELKK